MNIYRIRNKETGEFFESPDGYMLWLRKESAERRLQDYHHLKNYKEWRSQWEIIEYELKEVHSGS